MQEMNNRMS